MLQLRLGLSSKCKSRKKIVNEVMDDYQTNQPKSMSREVTKSTKKNWKRKSYGYSKSMFTLRNQNDILYSLPFDQ